MKNIFTNLFKKKAPVVKEKPIKRPPDAELPADPNKPVKQ